MSDKPRILVVDDEKIVCVSIKRILSREGYEVDAVMTTAEALDKVDDHEYGLVITDLMMPEMNGIELMHTMRVRGLEMPFLMVTGYPTIRTAMQALRLGAIDYIPKPFTRQELMGPVNRALRRKGAREKMEMEGNAPAPAKPANPGDRFVLPEHAWALFHQDGTLEIGVEESFLGSAGEIERIETPDTNEMIEQGYPTIRIFTSDQGRHGVFAPFTGRVVAVNEDVANAPSKLTAKDWVLRIIPSNLEAETVMLIKEDIE